MTGSEVVLLLDNITICYGNRIACTQVTLEIRRGEVFALLGRNGAGKTSLIRCLLGQQKARKGGAYLFGMDVWSNRRKLLAKVGVVPEEPDAPPDMTASQIAAFCSGFYPEWNRRGFQACLDRFGVPVRIPFQHLSKGQKTLLHFALVLAHRPELLVLDDPTLGLDPVARAAIFEELVGDLADRTPTVLIATHDLAGIEGIAGRVGILYEGRLLVDMELETLKSCYRRLRYENGSTGIKCPRLLSAFFRVVRVCREGVAVEAVVADYEDDKFQRFCASAAVSGAVSSPMSLEEIIIAASNEEKGGAL
jgi:ABC-2 type transport system ATP-binding protein